MAECGRSQRQALRRSLPFSLSHLLNRGECGLYETLFQRIFYFNNVIYKKKPALNYILSMSELCGVWIISQYNCRFKKTEREYYIHTDKCTARRNPKCILVSDSSSTQKTRGLWCPSWKRSRVD